MFHDIVFRNCMILLFKPNCFCLRLAAVIHEDCQNVNYTVNNYTVKSNSVFICRNGGHVGGVKEETAAILEE